MESPLSRGTSKQVKMSTDSISDFPLDTGADMATDFETFESLGLHKALLRALDEEGYEAPSDIQLAAIPHILAGRDLIGTSQTGTGKTAGLCRADSRSAAITSGSASRGHSRPRADADSRTCPTG
jgi:hypothetical protein